MEADGQIPYTTIGDETYFALASNPNYNINYTWQTFVRMDWLKQVGYDHVPTKRDEYLDAMKKIQEAGLCEHPGGGTMITGLGSDQNHAYRGIRLTSLTGLCMVIITFRHLELMQTTTC